MAHKLGMHWIRVHPDQHDYAHVERMQYKSVKLFEWHWSNRDACRDLLAVLPRDAYILARDHPMSEQKQDMWANPEGTGERHANEWADKVRSGNVHTPTERTFFLGLNEPDATSGDRAAIDRYTAAFLQRLRGHGLRGGAFNFSTGHPRTVDGTPNTPPDYTVFERSHHAIVEGHHIAVLHIYGTAAVPCVPGHYDRLKACPWQDVTWIVGECGADEHVIGGGPHDGYLRTMGAGESYCRWLDDFVLGVNDPRIHSYQVFTYDFSHPWDSFDIRPIRPWLEGYTWQHANVATAPQHTVHIPAVGTGPTPPESTATVYVTAPSGLNLRALPDVAATKMIAIPFAAPVTVTGVANINGWLRATYNGVSGWLASAYVSTTQPPQKPPFGVPDFTPPPQPTDTWTRSRAFVAKWEGGYQNVPNDAGNWTECEVGKGENKGTKYGISACSYPHLDIKNLTPQDAERIYRTDYWQASGADQLPWPACLLVFDTAVLHGVGTAKTWLRDVGPNPYAFAAKRLRVYTKMSNWDFWGKAWVNRVADLLEEMGKP